MQNLENVASLDKQYYMNTFGERLPHYFTHGSGCTLYDQDGKAFLDFLGGIAVNALGYAHEGFTKAMQDQLGKLLHYSNYFYAPAQARLAQLLCENSCADKVFFANSGAEANEGAIKLARAYFYKKSEVKYEIICAENSFHGRTLASLAATGQEKYRAPFAPLPDGFRFVPYGDAAAVMAAVNGKTCAVMVECIQGEGGVIEGGSDYLRALRTICDEAGILLIFDEVQTGMGRTGKLFAHQLYGVEPDIFTLAKALGNGLPMSALLCRDACAVFSPGEHGTTFGGSPLACAAGVFVMETLTAPGFLERVAATGAEFKQRLEQLKGRCEAVGEIRGQGYMLGIALDARVNAADVQKALLGRGFIVGTAGGNTVRLVPPLIMNLEQLCSILEPLETILKGV